MDLMMGGDNETEKVNDHSISNIYYRMKVENLYYFILFIYQFSLKNRKMLMMMRRRRMSNKGLWICLC